MTPWLMQFKEESKDIEFCPYCLLEREDKRQCCHEVHFAKFSDLDEEDQNQIAMEEYEMYLYKRAK